MSYETFELYTTGKERKKGENHLSKKIKPLGLATENDHGTIVLNMDELVFFNPLKKHPYLIGAPFTIQFHPQKPGKFRTTNDLRLNKPSIFFLQIVRVTRNGKSAGSASLLKNKLKKQDYWLQTHRISLIKYTRENIVDHAYYGEFGAFWAFDCKNSSLTPFYNDWTETGNLGEYAKLHPYNRGGWFTKMMDTPGTTNYSAALIINSDTSKSDPAWKLFHDEKITTIERNHIIRQFEASRLASCVIEFQTFAVSYNYKDRTIEFLGGLDFNFHFAERKDHDYNQSPLLLNIKHLKKFTPEFLGCLESWNRNTPKHHLKLDIKYPDPEKDDLSLLPHLPRHHINKNGRIFFYNE